MKRQELLCHWQHSCLSSLFFLFIDWEYYLPLHPAVYTSLATKIYLWLWRNMSIEAQGYFCRAAGQRRKLEAAAAAAEGGSQVTSTHWGFETNGGFFDSTGSSWSGGYQEDIDARSSSFLPSVCLVVCLSQWMCPQSRTLNRTRFNIFENVFNLWHFHGSHRFCLISHYKQRVSKKNQKKPHRTNTLLESNSLMKYSALVMLKPVKLTPNPELTLTPKP